MSLDFNTISLIGRLTKDPRINHTGTGKTVASFSVANNRGKDQPTVFFDVTAWGKLAEFSQNHLKKAMRVLITGRIDLDIYTDKNGVEQKRMVITAEQLYFVDSKPQGTQQDQQWDNSPRQQIDPIW
jgi:single-strand DNA-binding protein